MKTAALASMILAASVLGFSCGDSDSGTPAQSSFSYGGTQAPGDYWEWVIKWETAASGTFSAKNYGTTAGKTAANTYSGTTTLLESKFTKFTIAETTDTSVSAGEAFYGVEIPGTAVLIQTAGSSPDFITCSVIGTVPTSATTYNWTRIPDATTMDNHTTTTGVISYGRSVISLASGTAYNSEDTAYDWDKTIADSSTTQMVLSEGKLFSPDESSPTCVTLMAPSGCFVSDMGTNGGFFGSIAPSVDIDIDDLVSHEFRGYCTIYNSSSSADVQPIYCKPSSTQKQMLSAAYSDVEAGTIASSGECAVDFSSATQPNAGLLFNISSVNASPGFEESIVTAVAEVGGKYVFSGFGRVKFSSSDPYRWENFIMVQVD